MISGRSDLGTAYPYRVTGAFREDALLIDTVCIFEVELVRIGEPRCEAVRTEPAPNKGAVLQHRSDKHSVGSFEGEVHALGVESYQVNRGWP